MSNLFQISSQQPLTAYKLIPRLEKISPACATQKTAGNCYKMNELMTALCNKGENKKSIINLVLHVCNSVNSILKRTFNKIVRLGKWWT